MDKHNKSVLKTAEKKMKEAKKLATRSLTSWGVDHTQASSLFEEAAMLFKSVGNLDKCILCLEKAADSNLKSNNNVMAGKNYDQAGTFLAKEKRFKEALKFFELGHITFYEDGKPERSTELLIKGAEALQKASAPFDQVSELYKRALEIMGDNEKYHYGMSYFQQYNSFLCKNEKFQECMDNLLVQKKGFQHLKQDHNIWKVNLSIIVLCLRQGKLKEADEHLEKFCREDNGFTKQDEYILADQFIDICDSRDEEGLKKLQKENKLKYLDPAISRIARKMELKGMKGNRIKAKKLLLDDGETDEEEEEDEESEGEGIL